MPIKIITTEDGSHSLYDEKLNETYHSTRGALGESLHVFIKEGLAHWLEQNTQKEVSILEIGFGTGLNALLSAQYAEKNHVKVIFTTLEPFPISKEIYENLNYGTTEEEVAFLQALHTCNWEKPFEVSKYFTLMKTTKRLEDFTSKSPFDIIFFDAFAPSKQPDVWSLGNLKKCYDLLDDGGILTTYCAQGQFKRNLSEVGFEVQSLRGAMGKKEMVRAVKV